ELVEGDTLRKWLAQPRPQADVASAFAQAGRGLLAAHAAGIVHGAFTTDRALFCRDGRVRVVDFGVARAGDERADLDAFRAALTQAGLRAEGSLDEVVGRLDAARVPRRRALWVAAPGVLLALAALGAV